MEKIVFAANEIWDCNEIPFLPEEYSRFKFGSKSIARKFGRDLASKFWKRCIRDSKPSEQIVVYSSPYNFIPTATGIMKDYFIRYLNEYLIDNDMNSVEEGKIHRNTTYREDYGQMNAEERLRMIGNDKFYIDAKFAEGKILVFIDDIKITGSHEVMVEKMCTEYAIQNKCYFLYFASLNDPSIPATFENDLNYAQVKTLLDVNWIIRNDEFIPNTRVVKFILNSDPKLCAPFLQYQSDKFLDNLWHLAIGNEYHKIPEYRDNLNLLRSLITN
jgi:hypothetical protein